MIETFSDAVKFLQEYIPDPSKKFPGKFGLLRMKKLMEFLGNPQDSYPTIHVGGTSGKGSTATFIASILSQEYKVGLYTSPHLVRVNERIKIFSRGPLAISARGPLMRDKDISETEFIDLVSFIKPFIGKVEKSKFAPPSYFEIVTAMAFLVFQREKVDIAVIEVGMGGRYDATNVIKKPLVAVLTNVGLDHTEILGDTVEKIARDKSGIIKEGIEVVSGVMQRSVKKIVEQKCKKMNANLSLLIPPPRPCVAKGYAGGAGSPASWRATTRGDFDVFSYRVKKLTPKGSVFDYFGKKTYQNLELKLLGEYQIANAALAIRAIEISRGPLAISARGPLIKAHDIKIGLEQAFIPGRLEIIRKKPLVILDGAHNEEKMHALMDSIRKIYPDKHVTALLAIKADKRAEAMLKEIVPHCDHIVLTQYSLTTDMGKTLSYQAETLKEIIHHIDPKMSVESISSPEIAIDKIRRNIRDGLFLITGSLYLVGEVKKSLQAKA